MRPSGRTLASRMMSDELPGAGPKLSISRSPGTMRYSGTRLQSSVVVAFPESAATLSGTAVRLEASTLDGANATSRHAHNAKIRYLFMNAPDRYWAPVRMGGEFPAHTPGADCTIDSADAGGQTSRPTLPKAVTKERLGKPPPKKRGLAAVRVAKRGQYTLTPQKLSIRTPARVGRALFKARPACREPCFKNGLYPSGRVGDRPMEALSRSISRTSQALCRQCWTGKRLSAPDRQLLRGPQLRPIPLQQREESGSRDGQ